MIDAPQCLVKNEHSFYDSAMAKVSAEYLDARRRHILDAARRCFVRNGFHATSMQDIFAEAGMSAGGVYRYFKSKDDLVDAIAANALSFVYGSFEALLATTDLPSLDEAVARILDQIVRLDREQSTIAIGIQVWAEALRAPRLAARVAEILGNIRLLLTRLVERYQQDGRIDRDLPAGDVGRTLSMLVNGYMLQHALLGDVEVAHVRNGLKALLDATER
jgi:TetR/AcrR family transcriptional regulator, transcriptional repressor of aconitase